MQARVVPMIGRGRMRVWRIIVLPGGQVIWALHTPCPLVASVLCFSQTGRHTHISTGWGESPLAADEVPDVGGGQFA